MNNKYTQIPTKYLFEKIFKGKTPEYQEDKTDYIVVGQRNNGKNGFTFINAKYTNKNFFEGRPKIEFLRYGDILINSLGGGTCGRVGVYDLISEKKILTDGIPFILRNKTYDKFLFYSIYSQQKYLEDLSIGATNEISLTYDVLRNYKIFYCNDLHMRKNIVDLLDKNCKKIKQLIFNQEVQIKKLKEYKQSLITEVVTKGLDKSIQMKDSGIEWVGTIPESWNVVLLSSIFYETKNKNKNMICDNLLSLSYGKIKTKDINTKDGLLPESFEGYNIIKINDIVLRLTDLQNDHKSLRTGLCTQEGIITSAYVTLRAKVNFISSVYMHYYLHAFDLAKGFYGMGDGVRQGLSFEGIKKLNLLLPSLYEQQELSTYLDEKCLQIDNLIGIKQQKIEKLNEYKKSLIYEYITGKKEVN